MYEFLNKALAESDVAQVDLGTIYVEKEIVYNFICNYRDTLLLNIKDYYKGKNTTFNVANGYMVELIDTSISKTMFSRILRYTGFHYYLQIYNVITKRSITLSVSDDTNFLGVNLFSNISLTSKNLDLHTEETKFLIKSTESVLTHFLDITYEFLENNNTSSVVYFKSHNLI